MAHRKWNWEQEDWPRFRYDQKKLDPLETDFLLQAGVLTRTGALKGTRYHLPLGNS